VMMLSCMSFAAMNSMSYGCSAGNTSSSAYTSLDEDVRCTVSLSGYYDSVDSQTGGRGTISASAIGLDYASASDSYPYSTLVSISAVHGAMGHEDAYSSDYLG